MTQFHLILMFGFFGAIKGQCDPTFSNIYYLSGFTTYGYKIESPNYPNNYDNDENECWLIETSNGSTLSIAIASFSTESSSDYLRIYDGYNTSGDLLSTLSGDIRSARTYQTTGSAVYMSFTSDSSVTDDGFQACVCPANITSCSCGSSSSWTNWDSGSSWSSWNSGSSWTLWSSWSSSSTTTSLSIGAIAGISVGVILFILIPIIIGVSIACCAKTTESRNTYAARRRQAGNTAVILNGNAASGSVKQNQVQPQPGPYPYGQPMMGPAMMGPGPGYGPPGGPGGPGGPPPAGMLPPLGPSAPAYGMGPPPPYQPSPEKKNPPAPAAAAAAAAAPAPAVNHQDPAYPPPAGGDHVPEAFVYIPPSQGQK